MFNAMITIQFLFAGKCREYFKTSNIRYLVSANHVTEGNISCESINNHEEADTLMVWHSIHASLDRNENDTITVYSPDTDVLCLLVAFKPSMIKHVFMKTDNHFIRIESVYNSRGSLKSKALLSLHTLSGCDTTGRFFGKGKLQWWNCFQEVNDDIIKAIECIQSASPLQYVDILQIFVCKLYCPKALQIKTLSEARWYLFTRSSAQSEKLCPTLGAFKQAVLRAHCQARTWLLSDQSVRDLPDPLVNGWELADGSYVACTTKETIAPTAILNLIKCGCNKSNCQSNSCKCFKANLVCTDLCTCADTCENMDYQRNKGKEQEEEDEEFFEEFAL